jgi:ubiquitin carboxyl-terminal hydrolase 7
MFSETKKRLQNRIGVSDKDFAKIKFAVTNTKTMDVKYLEDGNIVFCLGCF